MDTQKLYLQWLTHTIFSSRDPLQSIYTECDNRHEHFSSLYHPESLWDTHTPNLKTQAAGFSKILISVPKTTLFYSVECHL
jgi:hypothetical protein